MPCKVGLSPSIMRVYRVDPPAMPLPAGIAPEAAFCLWRSVGGTAARSFGGALKRSFKCRLRVDSAKMSACLGRENFALSLPFRANFAPGSREFSPH